MKPVTDPGRAGGVEGSWQVFSKVLVANRGEIAIRAFRAAYELGCQTVAVFRAELASWSLRAAPASRAQQAADAAGRRAKS